VGQPVLAGARSLIRHSQPPPRLERIEVERTGE
jgi:hypothetical protein